MKTKLASLIAVLMILPGSTIPATAAIPATQPAVPCLQSCIVPNLIGLTYDNAVQAWHAAGFTQPVISANFGQGLVVVYQSIPPGATECCNTTVIGVVLGSLN